jgi:hypothetical protein
MFCDNCGVPVDEGLGQEEVRMAEAVYEETKAGQPLMSRRAFVASGFVAAGMLLFGCDNKTNVVPNGETEPDDEQTRPNGSNSSTPENPQATETEKPDPERLANGSIGETDIVSHDGYTFHVEWSVGDVTVRDDLSHGKPGEKGLVATIHDVEISITNTTPSKTALTPRVEIMPVFKYREIQDPTDERLITALVVVSGEDVTQEERFNNHLGFDVVATRENLPAGSCYSASEDLMAVTGRDIGASLSYDETKTKRYNAEAVYIVPEDYQWPLGEPIGWVVAAPLLSDSKASSSSGAYFENPLESAIFRTFYFVPSTLE